MLFICQIYMRSVELISFPRCELYFGCSSFMLPILCSFKVVELDSIILEFIYNALQAFQEQKFCGAPGYGILKDF